MQWKRHTARSTAATHYAREFEIHELTAQVLLNRGFNGLASMRGFLYPTPSVLHDPFTMKNMESAVRRIRRAIVKRERVHIHGDYDVDGVSSTAVLMLGLRAAGADVHYHVINRNDSSVGLSVESFKRDHLPHRPRLIITADCGTSSLAAIDAAREHDIDVIVVDHHMPGPRLPRCAALLNPMQPRCEFPFKQLAAVGVAFHLVYALSLFLERDDVDWPEIPVADLTDLVALGTISDLVPLMDENRYFVTSGLELLRSARRPGICALMRSARLLKSDDPAGSQITARTIGFRLAPLINAAGRMNDANKCVELLITDSYRIADAITRELTEANQQRQAAEREVIGLAVAAAEPWVEAEAPIIVLADAGWHPGVLGIVASRLAERYARPALIASVDKDGMAKGSVRSPDSVDMLDALGACRDLLDTYGGHKVAAGVAFKAEHLTELRRRLAARVSAQLPDGGLPPRVVDIDATVDLGQLAEPFVDELEALAPFGAGNPEPVFEARRVQPIQPRAVGSNARLRLRQGPHIVEAFGFGMGARVGELRRAVDVIFSPRIVGAGAARHVELVVKDFTPS